LDNSVAVVNRSHRPFELIISPWVGARFDLQPGQRADLGFFLQDSGWSEVDCTDSAIFFHAWSETECTVTIHGNGHRQLETVLPEPSSRDHAEGRSIGLRQWVAKRTGSGMRLLVTSTTPVDLSRAEGFEVVPDGVNTVMLSRLGDEEQTSCKVLLVLEDEVLRVEA
jgi:hypothetical protein